MKIAVDARPLAQPLTGIGIYTASLLEQLLATEHLWCLYSDGPLAAGPWTDHPRVLIRHGQASPRSLQSLKIANWEFPRWSKRDKVDVFWSPRHHLPFLLPRSLPAVVTIHDLVWRRFPETMPWQARVLEWAAMSVSIARAQQVIAVSQFTADELAHFYPAAAGRCSVVHLAARRLSAVSVAADASPYFLFVGTQEPRKNLEVLLQAVALLPATHQRLLVAGAPGWGGIDAKALATELGIADRVEILGYVDDRRLAELYAGATALVFPSIYEGFGLPVVEAMSRGIPVIVSDRASLPEVAGDAGIVVATDSPQGLAAAMEKLATDETWRTGCAARSQQRSRDFSWERAAQQTLAILEAAAR